MRSTGTGKVWRNEKRIRADKRSAIKLVAVFIIGIFVLIGMRSYAAILQHENNVLTEQNEYIQAEIDSLNSQIADATRITKLEKVATEEYGMVYPDSDNCVKLGAEEGETSQGLADVIRSEAYN